MGVSELVNLSRENKKPTKWWGKAQLTMENVEVHFASTTRSVINNVIDVFLFISRTHLTRESTDLQVTQIINLEIF